MALVDCIGPAYVDPHNPNLKRMLLAPAQRMENREQPAGTDRENHRRPGEAVMRKGNNQGNVAPRYLLCGRTPLNDVIDIALNGNIMFPPNPGNKTPKSIICGMERTVDKAIKIPLCKPGISLNG